MTEQEIVKYSNRAAIKNATISGTMLGVEDHGILTAFVYLDFGGSGQGFGGYSLDDPLPREPGESFRRVGTVFGMEFIRQVLQVLGVEKWEALPGTSCRVVHDHGCVYAIGHYLKDEWFDPKKLAKEMKKHNG